MSVTSRANLFQSSAQEHVDTASKLVSIQGVLTHLPYFSPEAHTNSVLYPFCHSLKTLISAGRIIHGGLLLLGALFEKPSTNIPKVLIGIGLELCALVLNAINVLTACVVFLTRSLSTLSLGYPKKESATVANSFFGKIILNLYSGAENVLYEETTNLAL